MGLFDGNTSKPQLQAPITGEQFVFNNQTNPNTSDMYTQMLTSTKAELYASVVEQLAGMKYGTKQGKVMSKNIVDGKETEMATSTTESNWYEIVPGAKKLMSLTDALQIAGTVSNLVDQSYSSTFYDPNTQTVKIAALMAMSCAHCIDNTRVDFYSGSEADAASFAVMIVSRTHSILQRSSSGFFLKNVSTSTQNVFTKQVRDGDFANMKKASSLENLFGLGKGRQQ